MAKLLLQTYALRWVVAMANRVSDDGVKDIIADTKVDDTTPFITTANTIVDNNLLGRGYAETLLTQIELWLSCHLVACFDKSPTGEKLGDAQDNFGGSLGMGLDFTQYGQQVKILDKDGILASLGRRRAFIKVI